jgi:phospholipase C
MFRSTILAAALAMAAVSPVYAQQSTTLPIPEDALSPRELIAWSNLQIPRPAAEKEQLPVLQTQPKELRQDSAQRVPHVIDSEARQTPAQNQTTAQPSAHDSHIRTP